MTRARLCHVITGLGAGGAEAMLVKLLERLDRRRFDAEVISLLPGGVNAERLGAMGIPVTSLRMDKGVADPRALLALRQLMKQRRPNLVQTWMYHADLLGGLAAAGAGVEHIVWNIQNSCLPPSPKWHTRLACDASASLSDSVPERIVVCSSAGAAWHAERGYRRDKMVQIANGIDTVRFAPDAAARDHTRRQLGLKEDDVAIVLPARFAPEKDHRTFLAALALLVDHGHPVKAVLCGDGTAPDEAALSLLVDEAGVGDSVVRVGRHDDMPRLLNGVDIGCLSSSHVEAFSNALGEAMATGLPCVATDVGDAGPMLGDAALVPPSRDPQALADALERVVALPPEGRRELGEELRERVRTLFSLERTVEQYEALYEGLLGR